MKIKFKSIGTLLILVFILMFMLSYPDDTINSVLFAINIWMYNIFPSLFPFFILSDLLINYGFIELLSELFKNFMNRLGISGIASFPILVSLISGSPCGAKYTKQLLDNKLITIDEANYLIRFTHSVNPLFVIGTIGSFLLNNKMIGILILISIILGNFIISLIFRKKVIYNNEKISLKKAFLSMYNKKTSNNDNFVTILSNSIYNSIDLLLLLLGIIIVFLILSSFIERFYINKDIMILIKGILEVSQGVKVISNSNYILLYKVMIITFFLSFGGLSIHLQVASIIDKTKIKYKNFFISRIIHSFISTFLVFLFFTLFFN